MNREMPALHQASYSNTTYGLANMAPTLTTGTTALNNFGAAMGVGRVLDDHDRVILRGAKQADLPLNKPNPQEKPMTRRLVQVLIADTDENVPLEQSMLYTGSQKLTDATDQELFFEIDLKSILDAHNVQRITYVNKKVKERVEHLEPAKIRDLKMIVINVASF